MRWSIVRVIWARELRDQLRDRRTVFMIAVLPIFLYPVAGLGLLTFAAGQFNKSSTIGVLGSQYLPAWPPRADAFKAPTAPAACFGLLAAPLDHPGAAAQRVAALAGFGLLESYPPLFSAEGDRLRVPALYLDGGQAVELLHFRHLDGEAPASADIDHADRSALDDKQVDLLLVVPRDFVPLLDGGGRPPLAVLARTGDEHSRLADSRLTALLGRWKKRLKEARLLRQGLSPDFDDPIDVRDPERTRRVTRPASEDLFETLVRIFPFVLVMWSLAGALYPAVDLCAGEKERGTMETLLISPASREEIVWGKFLTIWVFSAATALLNLLSMGLTTWQFARMLPAASIRPGPLLWGVVLLLPLSAFFSALCLAVGAYARSSKEGQYYLMPLFLLTMPLVFLTLAPGVELSPFYSMVPVTGVALLLQRLMATGLPGPDLWAYFIPVLAPMVVYSWLALRWAIEQFNREEVLFREAERLDMRLWLRRLFRDKEPLPSSGQALFCFALILVLQWLAFGLSGADALPGRNLQRFLALGTVRTLAFVAAPALFMAVMLTTRPVPSLGLGLPPWWAWPAAVALALALLPPLAALTLLLLEQVPELRNQIFRLGGGSPDGTPPGAGPLGTGAAWQMLLVIAILPALCEELAFRGFILTGLRRRFRPLTAVLLSSFLFAVYQMNVFQAAPHFLMGCVLGLLVLRTASVWPAVLFHLVWNLLVVVPVLFPGAALPEALAEPQASWPLIALFAFGGLALAVPLVWLIWRQGPDMPGPADGLPEAAAVAAARPPAVPAENLSGPASS